MSIHYYRGERVYFRPLEAEDEPLLRRWYNDPDNWRTLGRFLPMNEEAEKAYLEGMYINREKVVLGIATFQDDRLIGVCGLHGLGTASRCAIYGIIVGEPAFQGRGFGSEATRLMVRYGFEELNLNRIELGVMAGNERARRAYERAGFIEEGRRRQAHFRGGRYHDEIAYAVLREDWPSDAPSQEVDYKNRPEVEANVC
jgi:RimJ/RimL family protein N-acetyltransferase